MRSLVWMVVWVPLVACSATVPEQSQPTEDSAADVVGDDADCPFDAQDVIEPPDAGAETAVEVVDAEGEDVAVLPDAVADAEDHDSVDIAAPPDQVVDSCVDGEGSDASEDAAALDTLADEADVALDCDSPDITEPDDIAADVPDAPVEVDAPEVAETPDAAADLAPPAGDFGQLCLPDAKCLAELVCYTFGDGIPRCTLACTAGDQCPAGSSGKVCTSKGFCKP